MNWQPEHEAILKRVAEGDRDGLGVLADHLADSGHPLAPVLHHLHAQAGRRVEFPHGVSQDTSGLYGHSGLFTDLRTRSTHRALGEADNPLPHGHQRVFFRVSHGTAFPHPLDPYPTEEFQGDVPLTDLLAAYPDLTTAPKEDRYARELEKGYGG